MFRVGFGRAGSFTGLSFILFAKAVEGILIYVFKLNRHIMLFEFSGRGENEYLVMTCRLRKNIGRGKTHCGDNPCKVGRVFL